MDKPGKSKRELSREYCKDFPTACYAPSDLEVFFEAGFDTCRESSSAEVDEKVSYYKKSGMEWQAKAFDLSAKLAEEEADYKSLSDKYLGLQEEIAEQAAEVEECTLSLTPDARIRELEAYCDGFRTVIEENDAKLAEQAAEIARLREGVLAAVKHLRLFNQTSGYRGGEQQLLERLEALAPQAKEGEK